VPKLLDLGVAEVNCKNCGKPIVEIEHMGTKGWYHRDELHDNRVRQSCGLKEPFPMAEPQ